MRPYLEIAHKRFDTVPIKESNNKTISLMWSEVVSRLKTFPEQNLLDISSFSQRRTLFTAQGVSYQSTLYLGGYLEPEGLSSIYLHLTNEQREIVGSHHYFIHCLNGHLLDIESDMKVIPGYDQSGLGSSLAQIDEEVQRLIADLFKLHLSQKITHIKYTVVDATTEQNPLWTTRQFRGQTGWTQIDEKTWQRTLVITPPIE
jgi:hypothetical protein